MYERSEPAGEDEANTIDLKVQTLVLKFEHGCCRQIFQNEYLQVSSDMTPDDVVQKILELSQ